MEFHLFDQSIEKIACQSCHVYTREIRITFSSKETFDLCRGCLPILRNRLKSIVKRLPVLKKGSEPPPRDE
jgi:hypothetical protein